MIEVTVGDDDVPDRFELEPGADEIPSEFKATARVDQQRRAPVCRQDHPDRGSRLVQWSAGAEKGDERLAGHDCGGGAGSTLAGGTAGAAITPTEFIGNPALPPDQRTGLAGLANIDEVNMLVAPDEVNGSVANNFQITNALVDQCELLRERFTILSIAQGQGLVQTIQPPRDSTYGAVYYPWIRVFDPVTCADPLIVDPAQLTVRARIF